MIAANAFGMPASGWFGASAGMEAGAAGCTCAVSLIDRRTGAAHRVNGVPLVVFTRHPDEVAAGLLAGRNPDVWEARIEHPGQESRR